MSRHTNLFNLAALLLWSALLVFPGTKPVRAMDTHRQADAKFLVQWAMADYDSLGTALFEKMNQPHSPYADGSLYLFVIAQDGRILGHAGEPNRVGNNSKDTLDARGVRLWPLIQKAGTPHGGWMRYTFKNPLTQRAEPKRSWLVLHKGLYFGAGIYGQ